MAKQGMARPDRTHTKPTNDVSHVSEIQGEAKRTKKPAKPVIGDTAGVEMKVYHKLKGNGSVGEAKP